jgi:hypothetical protein
VPRDKSLGEALGRLTIRVLLTVQELPLVPGEHLPRVPDAAGLFLPRGDQVGNREHASPPHVSQNYEPLQRLKMVMSKMGSKRYRYST